MNLPENAIYIRLKKDVAPDSFNSKKFYPAGAIILGFKTDYGYEVPIASHWSKSYDNDEELQNELGELTTKEDYDAYVATMLNPPPPPERPNFGAELESIPALTDHEEEHIKPNTNTNTSIITTSSPSGNLRNAALAFNTQAEKYRELIQGFETTLSQHADAIKKMVLRQSSALEARLASMRKEMTMVNHALEMINLYLGSTEEVVILREGKKADPSSPIVIRQRLVYMDEEAMLLDAGENGDGIDCTKLAVFDKLLVERNLLANILPEEKGVVVAQVTKNAKSYKELDPLTKMELNEANAQTYWIVRNGECVWRFWSGLELPNGGKLFPSDVQSVSEHRPGSREYQAEIEKAQGDQLAFMKAGLMLQGLIDRTNIFAPFQQGQRPQLTNPMTWGDNLKLLFDASGLGEGCKPIREWILDANNHVEGGERIVIGTVDKDDLQPKYATGIHEAGPLRIKKTQSRLKASFPRTDTWNDKVSYATVNLNKTGRNWLAFDNVKTEDIEFYIRSREYKDDYDVTLPMLIEALRVKRKEEAEEKPFRTLILQELERLGLTSVAHKLDSIIHLWKTKNKNTGPS